MQGLLKPQGGAQPAESPEDLIRQGMEEDDGLDENHPVFKAGMEWVRTVLFKKGAADNYANVLRKSEDKGDALANIAYELVEVADTKSNGDLPRELLVMFASFVLQELVDVADTAGAEIQPSDIAEAWKLMIQRYLGEQGMDVEEIAAAMNQVDTSMFNEQAGAESAAAPPMAGEPQEGMA